MESEYVGEEIFYQSMSIVVVSIHSNKHKLIK